MGTTTNTRTILTTKRLLLVVGIATFLGLVVLFVADNFVLVQIRLVNLRIEMRLAWALLITFLLGILGGLLLAWLLRRGER